MMISTEILDGDQRFQDALSDEGFSYGEAAGFIAVLAAGAPVVLVAEASVHIRSRALELADRIGAVLSDALVAVAPEYALGARA